MNFILSVPNADKEEGVKNPKCMCSSLMEAPCQLSYLVPSLPPLSSVDLLPLAKLGRVAIKWGNAVMFGYVKATKL